MRALDIRIGPLDVRLTFEEPALAAAVAQGLDAFRAVPSADPRILHITRRRGSAAVDAARAQAPCGLPALELDAAGHARGVLLTRDPSRPPAPQRLGGVLNLIRAALERWLPPAGGLALHAAAVVLDGRGLLALGDSGAGKSTLAELSGAALADEGAIAFCRDQGWWTCATPFFGADFDGVRGGGQAPLAACVELVQASQLALTPQTPRAALAMLLRQCAQVERSAQELQQMVDLATHLAQVVPSYRFAFTPEREAIDFLSEQLAARSEVPAR